MAFLLTAETANVFVLIILVAVLILCALSILDPVFVLVLLAEVL